MAQRARVLAAGADHDLVVDGAELLFLALARVEVLVVLDLGEREHAARGLTLRARAVAPAAPRVESGATAAETREAGATGSERARRDAIVLDGRCDVRGLRRGLRD